MANKNDSKHDISQAKNKTNKKNNSKKSQSKYKKIFKRIFLGMLIVLLLFSVIGLGYIFAIIKSAPPLDVNSILNLSQPSMLYDNNGEYIDNLPTEEERYIIKFENMPENLRNAYVAIEDERFYEHKGIDIKRILGALYRDVVYIVTGRGGLHGASTLTQQLIKNTVLTNETTIERKVKEIYLSLKLESKLSKDQILEAYLNTIPLGGLVYGVEAASRYYFEKPAKDLTLPECAFIAGLTQAPTSYSPYNPENKENPDRYLNRTKAVLMKMRDLKYITTEEYDDAYAFVDNNKFAFSQSEADYSLNYEWFAYPAVDQVKRDLKEKYKYTDEEISKLMVNGGLKIYTTMDRKIQDSTQAILDQRENLSIDQYANPEDFDENNVPLLQASAVITDYRTGEVKALVGGRGKQPARSTNRAYDILRSIGSTTKPLTVYGPAIDTKQFTAATVIDDAPLPSSIGDQYGGYSPNNWNFKFDGLITPRESLALSKNVPTVIVEHTIGTKTGLAYAKKLGLVYDENTTLSTLALGESNDSNEGGNSYILSSAFGTFGNNGIYTEPRLYTKVVDATGKVILESEPKQTQVFSPQAAYIMQELLKGPLTFDGANAKFSDIPVIGKTGTTEHVTDFLFEGLTPYYSGAVWIGYDNHRPMGGASYSSSAASLWGKVMAPIHEGLEPKEISSRPDGIISVSVCKDSGKKPTDLCTRDQRGSRVHNELFIEGTEPTGVCDVHVTAKVNRNNNKLATENTPKGLIENRVFIRKERPYSGTADYQYILPTEKDDTKAEVQTPQEKPNNNNNSNNNNSNTNGNNNNSNSNNSNSDSNNDSNNNNSNNDSNNNNNNNNNNNGNNQRNTNVVNTNPLMSLRTLCNLMF
ncbi:transglycosylase domain-containing protein [Clostridium septicum]|uniref:Penicillin-binding protein 1A n=1 Tax=Clostridium septicum TaxID=1504 RepID=A0A9N7JN14_CLOSE|nr:PBP1A family penicillin-binding protein [Clostridium septicum]AYE35448.1 peptidase [Clostridium septicum]MDU1314102.1 PBP1A family penicillin-binding protein [Clostridium septicum]QAS60836.1 PBP1A family penicillin-binding protein [Clostridium septicum]UEC19896.1 PBP1A family penicillin-binding protein [Clostridium septicum]USS02044.1 PBP1A family penicillin-binding protein [Clostridium septicum]